MSSNHHLDGFILENKLQAEKKLPVTRHYNKEQRFIFGLRANFIRAISNYWNVHQAKS